MDVIATFMSRLKYAYAISSSPERAIRLYRT